MQALEIMITYEKTDKKYFIPLNLIECKCKPMKDTINKLKNMLTHTRQLLNQLSLTELEHKPSPDKWSKKEILGHLIDSAISNLQRFTEIQFEPKPYKVRRYNQDALVQANDYQHADLARLLELWLALNRRIVAVIKLQNPETLGYEVKIGKKEITTLAWLINDYADHLEHHIRQIGPEKK